MPLTIVEGPDGAGKTTLIEAWKKEANVTVVHHGAYLNESAIAHLYMSSLRDAHGAEGHVVFDRSWLAEPIYGRAFRDGVDRIGPERARMLERCALALNAIVVMCLPPITRCVANWESRREREYLTRVEALHDVWAGYAQLLTEMRNDRHALQVVRYDYTIHARPRLDTPSLAALRSGHPIEHTGAGAWRPGEVALLIGDQINANVVHGDTWRPPFVSFNEGGCSAWLARGLESHGISERSLYWVNSSSTAGAPLDASFVDALRPKKIIALGRQAAHWCIENSLVFDDVPHPQFWKRFHYNKPYPLFELLKGL